MRYSYILPLFLSLLFACATQPPSTDAPLGCLATPARLATPTFAPTAPPILTQVTSDRIAAGTASALPTPPACNELACAYATFARGQQILALDAASNTYWTVSVEHIGGKTVNVSRWIASRSRRARRNRSTR